MKKVNLDVVHKNSFDAEKEELLSHREPVDENGDIREVRRLSVSECRTIHEKYCDEDELRERNRGRVQGLIDYKEPYNQRLLNDAGRHHQFNVNFGAGAQIINEAVNPYINIYTTTDQFLELPLKPGTFEVNDEGVIRSIIGEEFTNMVRRWDAGLDSYIQLVNQFATQGVSIADMTDGDSWHYSPSSLSKFKFPARSKPIASSLDICSCTERISSVQLYQYVKNEKEASEVGWNKQAVIKAIQSASKNDDSFDEDNMEEVEEKVKSADIEDSSMTGTVEIIKMWVKEYSGKVSYYICSRETKGASNNASKTTDQFLYKREEQYECMSEAIHIFNFMTGTHGNIHTIRGLGFMVYNQINALNKMQCKMLDSASDAMSTKFIAPSEKDLSNIPIVHAGPSTIIPQHLTIAPQQHAPDLQKSAMPAIAQLNAQIDNKSSATSLGNVFSNKQDRRSSLEVAGAIEHFSNVNTAAQKLFEIPWRILLVEQAKRAFRSNQDTASKAGKEAKRMMDKCIARGVPEEVFTKNLIDFEEAKVIMPVGHGHKAAQKAAYQELGQMIGSMDEVGRKNYTNDYAVVLVGPEKADAYFNLNDNERRTIDFKIAELENNQLMQGLPVTVSPSENALVHLRVHIPKLIEMQVAYEEGDIEIEQAVEQTYPLFEHAMETLQRAMVPGDQQPEINLFKQQMQQISEMMVNGIKALKKKEREQAEMMQQQAMQQQQPQEQQFENIKLQEERQKHLQDMQHKVESHELDMRMRQEKFQQEKIERQEDAARKAVAEDAKAAMSVVDKIKEANNE